MMALRKPDLQPSKTLQIKKKREKHTRFTHCTRIRNAHTQDSLANEKISLKKHSVTGGFFEG